MSRREELEKELESIETRIGSARADMPKELLDTMKKERASILFELDNLYDDYETETE